MVTVATESNDGFVRFTRSVQRNKLPLHVLGMGQEWTGGDMHYPGGGQKVIFMKEFLEKVKDNKDLIIIFSDR